MASIVVGCSNERASDLGERRNALFQDIEAVGEACGLKSIGLSPLVEGVYRNHELPKLDTPIEFYSYEPVSHEAIECVGSFSGRSGYRFKVIQFDRGLHGDD